MPTQWCADCRPRNAVPAPVATRATPSPRNLAAQIHAAANGGTKPQREPKDVLDEDDFRALVTLTEFRRTEGTLPTGSPVQRLTTQRAVADLYGMSPALLSQWVASYRWLVNAGLVEAERRPRMRTARELYHLKDRAGSSSGVRAFLAQQSSEIATSEPAKRATLWDELVERTRRLARNGEMAGLEPASSSAADRTCSVTPAWQTYDKWNAAFAQEVFNADCASMPAYLDVEDDLLESVGSRLGLDLTAKAAAEALCTAVRDTLILGSDAGAGSVLSGHRERLDAWRSRASAGAGTDDPPPVIALLAVFARAADLMGEDDRFQANAYFPRLNQLLDISGSDDRRLQASFRRESERFWGALNDWLSGLDGAIGLPTAEAIGYRYVGIPLSQALIRAADRHRFGHFFDAADLEPGLILSSGDMTAHLDRWIKAGEASASIAKLWGSPNGRKIVADAAAISLSQWDGTFRTDAHDDRHVQKPVLTARVTKLLSGKRLRLGFALRGHLGGRDGLPARWEVTSAKGSPEVELVAINDRLLTPDIPAEVDPSSLLTGELAVRPVETGSSLTVSSRRPQPMVVLSYVEEAGLFVEVDRVRMLESHLLLVNSSSRRFNGAGAIDFDRLLDDIAEPGHSKDETLKGVPSGWTLYRDVTVARPHTLSEALLEPLRPAQTSTVIVGGGLRLPGHAVRWHVDAPLVLTGSVVGAAELHLSLVSVDGEEPIRAWTGEVEEITASTDGLGLLPGTYRAELEARVGQKNQTSVATFSLCSSDEPRVRTASDEVAYDLALPLGALSASATDGREGPMLPSSGSTPAADRAETEPAWWSLEPIQYAPETLAAPPAPDSCAVTGSHHWYIETHLQGMKKDRAECVKCGRVRLYSPTGKKKAAPTASYAQAPLRHLNFGEPASDISGESLLDAFTWLGGGSPAELARIVRQVFDSALTVDEIVRTVEVLGHVSVVRDPDTLAVERWEMGPRCLAGLADGTWMAIGAWSRNDVAALDEVSAEYGSTVQVDTSDWIPRRVVADLEEQEAREVGELLEASVEPQLGRRLLRVLPHLTAASDALHTMSAEGIYDAEWFDPQQARWVKTQSVAQPGAYRTKRGFVSMYFLRTALDIVNGQVRRGDPRVVKHLANVSRPIVGYDAESRRLFVPLGADLPGLYGRALTLQSGRPPSKVQGKALLAYPSVDEDVASALVSLLKG